MIRLLDCYARKVRLCDVACNHNVIIHQKDARPHEEINRLSRMPSAEQSNITAFVRVIQLLAERKTIFSWWI